MSSNFNFKKKLKKSEIEIRPTIILFIGLFLTLLVSLSLGYFLFERREMSNEIIFSKIESDIRLAFKQYLHPLQGIQATLHYANLNVQPDQFKKAAVSRNNFSNFKGALGFGFIRKVDAKDLSKFLALQKNIRPHFEIRRLKKDFPSENDKQSDSFFIIELIEPESINSKAVGLVVSDEENRLSAAIMAMKTAQPAVTKSIQLVQAERKEPGFLYFLPIYKTLTPPENEKNREKELFGWAYTPLLASEIANFILSQNPNTFPIRISEIENEVAGKVLYSEAKFSKRIFSSIRKKNIEVVGQNWLLEADFGTAIFSPEMATSVMVFLLGLLLTYWAFNRLRIFEIELHHRNQQVFSSELAVQNATKELKEKSDFLFSVVEGLPEMIGYWDKNLINKLSNSAFDIYYGRRPKEIIGLHMSQILPAYLYTNNKPYVETVLKGFSQEFETKLKDKNGITHTVICKYIPDFKEGEVSGFFEIVFDITELRSMEKQRNESQALLFSKSKLSLLGEMAGGIAHEINNPLAIISGKAQYMSHILKSEVLTDTFHDKLLKSTDTIIQTVNRIASIVRGLRTFARDSDKDPWSVVNLKEILEDTLSMVQEKLYHQSIKLSIEYGNQDLNLKCNHVQLSQVIMNLISNSIDAISQNDEKWIKIILNGNNKFITIQIIDSGNGISDEIVEKLMQPFFTTKSVGKGTGLGLSISKGIVESHGGTLEYKKQNEHTSFVITLPSLNVIANYDSKAG